MKKKDYVFLVLIYLIIINIPFNIGLMNFLGCSLNSFIFEKTIVEKVGIILYLGPIFWAKAMLYIFGLFGTLSVKAFTDMTKIIIITFICVLLVLFVIIGFIFTVVSNTVPGFCNSVRGKRLRLAGKLLLIIPYAIDFISVIAFFTLFVAQHFTLSGFFASVPYAVLDIVLIVLVILFARKKSFKKQKEIIIEN